MRLVYMDEAGISAREPVTVVAGVVIDADRQLMNMEEAIKECLLGVPPQLAEGFAFSAKKVWSDRALRDCWPMSNRLHFLCEMMRLPRKLGAPIVLGMNRREGTDWSRTGMVSGLGLRPDQVDHLMSFLTCVSRADLYIRERARPREVGSIIAEDYPELRSLLKMVPAILRENPMVSPNQDVFIPTAAEREQGYITQRDELRVTRIRRSVHFVEKHDDLAMYLADAVAFGLRAYFADLRFGETFAEAIFGRQPVRGDWEGPASAARSNYPTIDTHPDHFT
ncbi:MAG: hypothetical protein AAGB19_14420 [Cyanobacteria bacterium P01_F01_bin.3]